MTDVVHSDTTFNAANLAPVNENAVQFFSLLLAVGVVALAVRIVESVSREAAWGMVIAIILSIMIVRTNVVDDLNVILSNIGVLR